MSATATKRKGAKKSTKPTVPSLLFVRPTLVIDEKLKDWADDFSVPHLPKWFTQEHLTARIQHAKQLSEMTQGMANVVFCPGQFFENERDASHGHLYAVWLEVDERTLDDRNDEPLAEQLADLLVDYSAKLMGVANSLYARCKEGGAA